MVSTIHSAWRNLLGTKPAGGLIKPANQARDAKNYAEAARLYEAHLATDPLNASIHVQCGHMYKEMGRLAEAGRHYLIAYAMMPNDTDLNIQLGHYYKVSGKPEEAASFYHRATELSPDAPDARRELVAVIAQAATMPHVAPTSHVVHGVPYSAAKHCAIPPGDDNDNGGAWGEPAPRGAASSLGIPQAVLGYFDSFSDGIARGWAYDANRPNETMTLHVMIDGRDVGVIQCNQQREDVRHNLSHPTGAVGFEFEAPSSYFDGRSHAIAFRTASGVTIPYMTAGQPDNTSDTLQFDGKLHAKITGVVDGLYQGHLQGWAVQTMPRATAPSGGCTIVVTCDGVHVAQARADRWRGDVANMTRSDPNCGFRIPLPEMFRKAYPQTFRVHVVPGNIELVNSPYTTTVLYDHLEARFAEVASIIDHLQKDLALVREHVTKLRVLPEKTIEQYDGWAREYYADLRKRVAAGRITNAPLPATLAPLVSVLVPTYKPLLTDFTAAVESVIAQTYQNWELIIVDDCSGQPQLTALIEDFCRRDPRIRAVARTENGNISEATNTAIEAARGEWVAFFDHDDLLVDVALEVMVGHAIGSGASVLYSDEDKIDQLGYFSEPNLKPDWNHRYILGCNYVCHLLVVRSEVLTTVGPLRTKYNGAQDHDLVLRISEHVSASKIHHVPELLYHWRKTPNSTAVSISNKDYAVKAGVAAVADHLDRLGKESAVSSINGLTIYKVDWLYKAFPKVCIIIPFKDHIEMTRLCLDRIEKYTQWPGLEIILVNNWSITEDAVYFIKEVRNIPGVRVIDVAEEFNYSRLNNLAVAESDAEYIVFMNNDLLVTQHDWLRVLVNEALADDEVGVVGGMLVYPNGSIQHAGLVVGAPEIAAYLHHGGSPTDYGYTGRSILPHEVTAVTAACMLVRASVFHDVGGFDETDLKIAYNDVDLCLKVRSASSKVVYASGFVAEHHESYSRGSDDRPESERRFSQERQCMLDRWGNVPLFKQDPAYNLHFAPGGRKFFDLRAIVANEDLPAND